MRFPTALLAATLLVPAAQAGNTPLSPRAAPSGIDVACFTLRNADACPKPFSRKECWRMVRMGLNGSLYTQLECTWVPTDNKDAIRNSLR